MMIHLQLDTYNLSEVINQAILSLKKGGVIIAPFDTVYGFLADAKNESAIKKIYTLKDRVADKPLGIVIPHLSSIAKDINLTQTASDFINQHTPGKYTFIVKIRNTSFISLRCQKNGTVAIRFPDSELISGLASEYGQPLAQTSANRAGAGECFCLDCLKQQLPAAELKSVDLIIDGGRINSYGPSVIRDMTKKGFPIVERKL